MMFAVTFGIWIKCKDGELDYERSTELPFAPYPGLDIEDDAFGEFELLQVRWSGSEQRFECYSNFDLFDSRSIRWVKKRLKEAGWVEVECDEIIEVKPKKGGR
jgi:hypothetical protein